VRETEAITNELRWRSEGDWNAILRLGKRQRTGRAGSVRIILNLKTRNLATLAELGYRFRFTTATLFTPLQARYS
jgi:hypothetical protein